MSKENTFNRMLSAAIAFTAALAGCDMAREDRAVPADLIARHASRPVTIAASVTGGMQYEESWFLSINSAGDAVLQTGLFNVAKRRFAVSVRELDEFVDLALQNDVFALPPDFGEGVPDDFVRTLTVTIGDRTASFRFLSFDRIREVSDVESCQKAVVLRHKVRAWLDDFDDILDLREYESNCLATL